MGGKNFFWPVVLDSFATSRVLSREARLTFVGKSTKGYFMRFDGTYKFKSDKERLTSRVCSLEITLPDSAFETLMSNLDVVSVDELTMREFDIHSEGVGRVVAISPSRFDSLVKVRAA